jgi:hypothetical protein
MTVRLASAKETAWFDEQLGQHHYLGAGQPIGDYLRQIVVIDHQPVALLVWGPACYALKAGREQGSNLYMSRESRGQIFI